MALYSQCKINALASLCLRVNRASIACAANAAPSLPNEFKRRAVTTRALRASQPTRTACSLAAACHASACHALDVNIRATSQTKTPGRVSEEWRQTGACRTQHPAGCTSARAMRRTRIVMGDWSARDMAGAAKEAVRSESALRLRVADVENYLTICKLRYSLIRGIGTAPPHGDPPAPAAKPGIGSHLWSQWRLGALHSAATFPT